MRRTIVALTAIFLAPTAVMASVSSGELVGDSELGVSAATFQERQIAPAGDLANGQRGFMVLAKGDMSATGPGVGGQKGKKQGGHKGKQKEGNDNPDKGKDGSKGKGRDKS